MEEVKMGSMSGLVVLLAEGTSQAQVLAQLDRDFWLFMLVAAVCGAVGGLIYELLILNGRIELPHRETDLTEDLADGSARFLVDLGFLARVFIGAGAAVAALWLIEPESATALIAGSLIAGTAGIAVFRSLQDRLLAVIAAQQTAEAKQQNVVLASKVLEIDQEFQKLAGGDGGNSGAGVASRGDAEVSFSPAPPRPVLELESLARKLGEARGLAESAMAAGGGPVRPRVYRVLSGWAGVGEDDILPDTKKIVTVWTQKAGNGPPTEGNLANLAVLLKSEFPEAGLRLQHDDFRRGVDTVDKLIRHVAARVR
jgi:hypothetical protein